MELKDKFEFGKNKGLDLDYVIRHDAQYVLWCLKKKIFKVGLLIRLCCVYYARRQRKRRIKFLRILNREGGILQEIAAREFHEDCGDR